MIFISIDKNLDNSYGLLRGLKLKNNLDWVYIPSFIELPETFPYVDYTYEKVEYDDYFRLEVTSMSPAEKIEIPMPEIPKIKTNAELEAENTALKERLALLEDCFAAIAIDYYKVEEEVVE